VLVSGPDCFVGGTGAGVVVADARKMAVQQKVRERDECDARMEAACKNLLHTLPCEKGGPTMIGLWQAMARDASQQVGSTSTHAQHM